MRLLLLAACALLAACVHKIDIQQGNYVTEDVVAKVKQGMSKAEVKQALGTPLLADIFHADRWDYYFSNVQGRRASDRKRFSVFFKDDKVVAFEGNAHPPRPPPVGVPPPSVAR
jgi:outer membrane protein assembly factor BamE